MQPFADPGWVAWAPPLDPPTSGGLPYAEAEAIAEATGWPVEPHLTAAEQWEAYAAMLPPTPTVTQVNTGVQMVSYHPPAPTGDYGLAIIRAQWHRSFIEGGLDSVPLLVAPDGGQRDLLPDMDWWIDP